MKNSPFIQYNLGSHQNVIESALNKASIPQIAARIWGKDHTLWSPAPDEILNRLGWLELPASMLPELDQIQKFVAEVKKAGFTQAILLGMGGSSLAPELFSKTFPPSNSEHIALSILDSTDPGAVLAIKNSINIENTLFIVSTKSGGTVETLSFFKYFYNLVADSQGIDNAGEHFIAITDPGSKLVDIAKKFNFRKIFLNDPNIGGRFSALSFFGLVPAALSGIDNEKLLERAAQINSAKDNIASLAGVELGLVIGEFAKIGVDKLTFSLSPNLSHFGDWAEQLIAESLGKKGKGVLPVVWEPLAQHLQYQQDRLFVSIQLQNEAPSTDISSLSNAGHPIITLFLNDLYDLGFQFMFWELATAAAGFSLNIHPFNQPDVESAKVSARSLIEAYKTEGQFPKGQPSPFDPQTLAAFLDQIRPGDYVSIQAYLTPEKENLNSLQTLRLKIQEKYNIATTLGFGPRFLHSTGQLHKGDKGNGLFIQLISIDQQDIPIPDQVCQKDSSISFGLLKQAQAWGDAQALANKNRRVITFEISEDQIPELKKWEF